MVVTSFIVAAIGRCSRCGSRRRSCRRSQQSTTAAGATATTSSAASATASATTATERSVAVGGRFRFVAQLAFDRKSVPSQIPHLGPSVLISFFLFSSHFLKQHRFFVSYLNIRFVGDLKSLALPLASFFRLS